jgi:hypothetical protein
VALGGDTTITVDELFLILEMAYFQSGDKLQEKIYLNTFKILEKKCFRYYTYKECAQRNSQGHYCTLQRGQDSSPQDPQSGFDEKSREQSALIVVTVQHITLTTEIIPVVNPDFSKKTRQGLF